MYASVPDVVLDDGELASSISDVVSMMLYGDDRSMTDSVRVRATNANGFGLVVRSSDGSSTGNVTVCTEVSCEEERGIVHEMCRTMNVTSRNTSFDMFESFLSSVLTAVSVD